MNTIKNFLLLFLATHAGLIPLAETSRRHVCTRSNIVFLRSRQSTGLTFVRITEDLSIALDRLVYQATNILTEYGRTQLPGQRLWVILNSHVCATLTIDTSFDSKITGLHNLRADYQRLIEIVQTLQLLKESCDDFFEEIGLLEDAVFDVMCNVNKAVRFQGARVPRYVRMIPADDTCGGISRADKHQRNFVYLHQVKTVAQHMLNCNTIEYGTSHN